MKNLQKLIICAFNLEDENAQSEFSDVDKNAWYYKYVASGEKNGIVNGTGDGLFRRRRSDNKRRTLQQ